MTRVILDRGHRVVTCEIDPILVGLVRDRFAPELESGQLLILAGDVLARKNALSPDVNSIVGSLSRPRHLVANLPYAICTPVVEQLVAEPLAVDGVDALVQLEVAERWTAGPGSKAYAAISVYLSLLGRAAVGRRVPREVFTPRPKVESAVATWRRDPSADVPAARAALDVARLAFGQRRKTIRRSLEKLELPAAAWEELGVDPGLRAEALAPEQFRQIAARGSRSGNR